MPSPQSNQIDDLPTGRPIRLIYVKNRLGGWVQYSTPPGEARPRRGEQVMLLDGDIGKGAIVTFVIPFWNSSWVKVKYLTGGMKTLGEYFAEKGPKRAIHWRVR